VATRVLALTSQEESCRTGELKEKKEENFIFFLNLTPDFLRKNYDRNFSQKVFEIVKISSEFASKWLCGVNRVTKLSDGRFSQKIWQKGPVVGGICKKNQSPHSREPFRKILRAAPIPPMGSSRPRPCFGAYNFFPLQVLKPQPSVLKYCRL